MVELMLRKVDMWEKISSFAHSEEHWIARLECGHEVPTDPPGEDRASELECTLCGVDPEWKQTLSVLVKRDDLVISRGRFPIEIESDGDGAFAVIQPEVIRLPPDTIVTDIEFEFRSSNREWQDRIDSAFLDRPEPGEPDA